MNRKLIAICMAAALLLTFVNAAAVSAYTFTGGYFADTAAGVGDNDLDFCIQSSVPGDTSQGTNAAIAAINKWRAAVVLDPASTVNCANANVIFQGANLGGCGLLGQTIGSQANDTQVTIQLNTNCPWFVFTSTPVTDGQHDLITIMAHEVGHALGLNHSSPQRMMTSGYCVISNRINKLAADDAAGVRARYAGALTPTGTSFTTVAPCIP